MKGNAVSRNMMLRIPRLRWTCWNQQTFASKTFGKRCFCQGSGGNRCAPHPDNERTTGIDGFLFTVTVHMPSSIKGENTIRSRLHPTCKDSRIHPAPQL